MQCRNASLKVVSAGFNNKSSHVFEVLQHYLMSYVPICQKMCELGATWYSHSFKNVPIPVATEVTSFSSTSLREIILKENICQKATNVSSSDVF